MTLPDRLREDAAREHPNPLAGHGNVIAAAAQRRRRTRQAGVGGVAAAAVAAVALLLPGAGWGPDPIEPATTATTDAPTAPETATEPPPTTTPSAGAVRPELCQVPYTNVRPRVTPGAAPGPGEVRVSSVMVGVSDGGPVASITLANNADGERTALAHTAELFFVDRWTMETVGYAADDADPEPVALDRDAPTTLDQPFTPLACDGTPLPSGWYLLYARGSIEGASPWLAEPTLIGWADGEPGLPPSDIASTPADPAQAVPFDPDAYPWQPPATDGDLQLTGWLLDVPLSGSWRDADTVQEILTATNTGAEPISVSVYAWVVLVEPDGEIPISIAVEPRWEMPIEIDLGPGESQYVSAVHWLGLSMGDHRAPDEPLTLPGTYETYVVLVDAASYDPAARTGWAYGVGGPFPIEIEID